MKKNMACFTFLCFISALLLALQCRPSIAEDNTAFLSVTGPCDLQFPRDHGPHPGFRTEWWYYTGNLTAGSANRYGFQLTFFRSQISPPGYEKNWPVPSSAWRTQQIYLAHAAIADISAKRHLQAEAVSRQALNMAGGIQRGNKTAIFIKDWLLQIEPQYHFLKVNTDNFGYELTLTALKPPVRHGAAGFSRKGTAPGQASCYYSFTRLNTKGILSNAGITESVEGLSWMDHEFTTAPLGPGLAGWDWFSLQLSDHTDIMFFLLRKNEGGLSPTSSGTFVDSSGAARHLGKGDFRVDILHTWQSPVSGAVYPAKWRLQIFPLSVDVSITPNLSNQEIRSLKSTGVTYWEGSVRLDGIKKGRPITGQGYVELTGYAGAFDAPL